MPDSIPHACAPLIRNTALALLGRAGSHAGGRAARAATLFRVLRPMRCAREQREKLPSGDFYNHARLRFLPCRHARAACGSRDARHATGAGLRVKGARHERHEGKGDGRGQGLPRAQGLRDRRRGLAGARGHRRDRPRGGGRGRGPGLRRRHGPDRDGRLPRGPQGARAARGAGGDVARRQRRRLRRHPGPLRRGGDDGRQGEPSAPAPPRQLLRREGPLSTVGAAPDARDNAPWASPMAASTTIPPIAFAPLRLLCPHRTTRSARWRSTRLPQPRTRRFRRLRMPRRCIDLCRIPPLAVFFWRQ